MAWLRNSAIVFVCALALFLIIRISSWVNPPEEHTIVIPKDTAFVPVEHQTFQPSSLPFTSSKPPVKLPSNVRERDVDRVVTVETRGDSTGKHTVNIIETKDGDIFVLKDSTVSRVVVTKFQPPLFAFGIRFGGGLSTTRRANIMAVSPAAYFAPLEWSGWLHAPVGMVDLDGLGVGAQARVYHDIFLGVSKVWKYDGGEELKLTASFMF